MVHLRLGRRWSRPGGSLGKISPRSKYRSGSRLYQSISKLSFGVKGVMNTRKVVKASSAATSVEGLKASYLLTHMLQTQLPKRGNQRFDSVDREDEDFEDVDEDAADEQQCPSMAALPRLLM